MHNFWRLFRNHIGDADELGMEERVNINHHDTGAHSAGPPGRQNRSNSCKRNLFPASPPGVPSRLTLRFHGLNILGMQPLDRRDDEALDFHLGLAFRQALRIDRLLLFCVCQPPSILPERHPDPAVWVPGRDEHLNMLVTIKWAMRCERKIDCKGRRTTSHFRVDLEGVS